MSPALLISSTALLLVAAAAWLVTAPPREDREAVRRRLVAAHSNDDTHPIPSVLRPRGAGRLHRLTRGLDLVRAEEGVLRQAGVTMGAAEFLLIRLALAATAALVAAVAAPPWPGGLVAAGLAALVGFAAPAIWLRRQRARRQHDFETALPDALDLIAGGLRAGHGIAHGLELVATETLGPCAEEFGHVLQETRLGADLDVALGRLMRRTRSEDARLVATAVAVQRRAGGNLADVLGSMAQVVRERLRMRREVHTITTGPRVSGYFVAALPLLTGLMLFVLSPYYVGQLLSDPIGRILLMISGALTLVGLLVNHRIAQVEV